MNNVFFEVDSNYYLNLNHVVTVSFIEDPEFLGDSELIFHLSNDHEFSLTLFELADDNYCSTQIFKLLEYLRLYNLAETIGSYIHDLSLKNY